MPAQAGIQLNNIIIQIKPLGISLLNQIQFPSTLPFFDILFSLNC